MPGRDKLIEIVKEQAQDLSAEAAHLVHAAEHPGQCTEGYVAEHARHAHSAIDKAADAARILVVEEEK
jgi:hypothetical protein